jgi:hypothetical protein
MKAVRLCAFRGCQEPVRHPAERCPEHEHIYEAAMERWGTPMTRDEIVLGLRTMREAQGEEPRHA